MGALTRFALWLHPWLLRLYPHEFRVEYGEEVAGVFRQSVEDAAGDGWRALLAVLARELRDWPLNCLREHLRARGRAAPEPYIASISGWGAVAAGAPYLVFLLSFLSFGLTLPRSAPLLFLGAGVLAAWLRGWPGWVVSWLGILIFFGQNLLPYRLFGMGSEPAWNTLPRLLSSMSEVAIQAVWLVVLYLVVRRWPRYGALVFLPFLWVPWAFSMEFASQAVTALVMNAGFLVLALTAAAISMQRSASGDIWLLYGGALLFGGSQALGAALFSPGNQTLWQRLGPDWLGALAPATAILLLQTLNGWARDQDKTARRAARLMTAGALLAYLSLLALARLVMPSDLELFQMSLAPLLGGVWLLGSLLVLGGAWGLRRRFGERNVGILAVATALLLLLPLLHRPSFLSMSASAFIYQNDRLTAYREVVPLLRTADTVIALVGFAGMLLLPPALGHLRRQTAAFLMPPAAAGREGSWRQRLRRRQELREGAERPVTASEARPRRRLSWRLAALVAAAVVLVAGSIFFAAVFLPLQIEAEPYTQQLALGDLDGDGDLDAVLANTRRLLPTADNKILYNDGNGQFQDSGLNAGMGGTSVVLARRGDGTLDIAIGGMMGATLYYRRDNGFAPMTISTTSMPESGASQWHLQAGDLNGDGLDDLFLAGCCGAGSSGPAPGETQWFAPANRVLLGNGQGLTDSGQSLGARGSQAVALGDLDGDGDLDAFVGNTQSSGEREPMTNDEPNEVWLNDGRGNFSDSGQLLGRQRTYAVALGDVDGDGDLDALVGNEDADELWLNDGQGRFTLSEQRWSRRRTLSAFLVDLDGDGDLDAVTGHELSASFAWWRQGLLWWNDGSGVFTRDDQGIRFRPNAALAVGDVNGDGLPDIVSGALDQVAVWFNEGNGRFREAP